MNFFKKLFSRKKEESTIRLNSSQLYSFFGDLKKNIISAFTEELGVFKSELDSEIRKTLDLLSHLGSQTAKDARISKREQHIISSNKSEYIKNTKEFLNKIRSLIPHMKNDFSKSLALFERYFEELNKSNMKKHYILQEFFGQHIKDISISLKNIDIIMNKINITYAKMNIGSLFDLEEKINELDNTTKTKKSMLMDISAKKKEISKIRSKLSSLASDRSAIEKSKEFGELKEAKEKKSKLMAMLKEKESEITQLFSPLSHTFKKYSKISANPELIQAYTAQPFVALMSDSNLEIINLLGMLKQKIINNEISLNDKKKKKSLKAISSITRDRLSGLRSSYDRIMQDITKADVMVSQNSIEKTLMFIEHEISGLNSRIKTIEDNIAAIQKKYRRIDDAAIIQEIESMFSLFGKKVKINSNDSNTAPS